MFNQPVYQFRSTAGKSITILLSTRSGDWGNFRTQSEAERFVRTFQRFSYLWLRKRGYSNIEYRTVPRYDLRSLSYGYNPRTEEEKIRAAILSDMLHSENGSLPMSQWHGLRDDTPNIRKFIPTDYAKG